MPRKLGSTRVNPLASSSKYRACSGYSNWVGNAWLSLANPPRGGWFFGTHKKLNFVSTGRFCRRAREIQLSLWHGSTLSLPFDNVALDGSSSSSRNRKRLGCIFCVHNAGLCFCAKLNNLRERTTTLECTPVSWLSACGRIKVQRAWCEDIDIIKCTALLRAAAAVTVARTCGAQHRARLL